MRDKLRGSGLYRPIWRHKLRRMTDAPHRYPDWAQLLSPYGPVWDSAKHEAGGPRIAIATSLGLHFSANTIDSLLATALTFRGARVEFIYCDGLLPACQMLDYGFVPSRKRLVQKGPQADICDICSASGLANIAPLGLPTHLLSDYVEDTDREDAKNFAHDVAKLGLDANGDARISHARAGALRFYGREKMRDDAESKGMLKNYLEAAFLADKSAQKIFSDNRFDVVIAHHGIYVPQGLIANAAHDHNVRLVTWHPAYRKGRFIYQHDDTYHRAMIHEPVESWRSKTLTPAQEQDLSSYLSSREIGSQDWITFQRQSPQDSFDVHAAYDLDPNKDMLLLAANVAWDARLHYPESAFGSMIDWVVSTIEWFSENPDKQLIIRCHPGEVTNTPKALDRLDMMIAERYPNLPENVRVIPADDPVNTYTLAKSAKGVLVYNTKMSMEMAARGKPVVVAGDAWIRGKGFSRDADSPEAYTKLLDSDETFTPLNAEAVAHARQYTYHFFFRRCIPFDAFESLNDWPLMPLKSDIVQTLIDNSDRGLEVVCEGVMNGSAFEMTVPSE